MTTTRIHTAAAQPTKATLRQRISRRRALRAQAADSIAAYPAMRSAAILTLAPPAPVAAPAAAEATVSAPTRSRAYSQKLVPVS